MVSNSATSFPNGIAYGSDPIWWSFWTNPSWSKWCWNRHRLWIRALCIVLLVLWLVAMDSSIVPVQLGKAIGSSWIPQCSISRCSTASIRRSIVTCEHLLGKCTDEWAMERLICSRSSRGLHWTFFVVTRSEFCTEFVNIFVIYFDLSRNNVRNFAQRGRTGQCLFVPDC